MESAGYITREAKVISPSEDEKQHFASKPKVKQKSSKFPLQHEPKSSLLSRKSQYCHASYQSNCDRLTVSYATNCMSECGSISSGSCPSAKSSTASRALATMNNEYCIPFTYTPHIPSCQSKQSEIDCGHNPPSIESAILNKSEQSFSVSDENHSALLPQKVLLQDGFGTSGVYESQPGDWNTFFEFNAENIIPPPKIPNHFSDSCFFPNKVKSSQSMDKLSSVECESLLPKPCNSKSFSLDNTCSDSCDSVLPSPRSCDDKPFLPFRDQTHSTITCETVIPTPKSCAIESYIQVCDVNREIDLEEKSKRNCLETMSLKIENQNKLAVKDKCVKTCDIFTVDDLIEVGSKSLNEISISENANTIPELDFTTLPVTCRDNSIFPVNSQSDLLGIEPKSNFDARVDESRERNNSNDQSHLKFLNTESISDANYIGQLKISNSTVSSSQKHLNVLLADPKSHSDYSQQNNPLNNSIFNLNESHLQNPLKSSRILQGSSSRKDFFIKSSKSIDSGLGFLSEENLTISSSDIPSVFSESELNILPLTRKESPVKDWDANKISSDEEDYSASIPSFELNTYIESERERIDNLIDQLIGF